MSTTFFNNLLATWTEFSEKARGFSDIANSEVRSYCLVEFSVALVVSLGIDVHTTLY